MILNIRIVTLQFELTMPNVGSWNGVDTVKQTGLFIHRNVDKKTADKLDGKNFYYNFGDGWGANVKVTKHRKQKSNGFRGYDWMVDEILKYGKLFTVKERRDKNKFESEFEKFVKEYLKNNKIDTNSNFSFITDNLKNKLYQIVSFENYLKKKNNS